MIPRPSREPRAVLLALGVMAFLALAADRAAAGEDYTFRFGPSAGAVGGQADSTVLLDVGPGQFPVNAWSLGVCHGPEVDIVSVSDGGTTASIDPDFLQSQILPGQGWTVGVVLSFVGVETIPPGSGYALHVARYDLLEEGDATLVFCDTLGSPVPVGTLVTLADGLATTIPPAQIPGTIAIGLIPPFTCSIGSASGAAGATVGLSVAVDNPVPFDGFALGIRQPQGLFAVDAIAPGAAILAAAGGGGPAYFLANLAPAGGGEGDATVACLLSFLPPLAQVPAGAANEIAAITGTIDPAAAAGSELAIELTDELGVPPVLTRFAVAGTSVTPLTEPGLVEVTGGGGGAEFVRGDVGGDGALTLGDAVALAMYLFVAGAAPPCLDAADVNDSGGLLIDDVVVLLSYLFAGGAPPALPFPGCGPDPAADSLGCAASPCPP